MAARVTAALHAAAALLALGVIAGLYLRGLVFDYRAGWQSTFLGAEQVHAALRVGLAPALALTGIALPGPEALAAMRVTPGGPAATADAAPWLHLHAVTLALAVVLPRALLALAAAQSARARSRRIELPLRDPYFRRLLRRIDWRVEVQPHGAPLGADAALRLRDLLAQALGGRPALQIAAPVAYGDEEGAASSAEADLRLLWFDAAVTPEREIHGRLIERLREGGTPLLVVIDETAFEKRFAGLGERVAERRAAWHSVVRDHGATALPIDFARADAAALRLACESVNGAE
jgi:hypothetical protein